VRRGYRDEQLMFVGDVETVQTPDRMVPSVVRLQPLDEFYRICGRAVDSLDRAGLKMAAVRTYWERGVISWNAAAVRDEGDREEIQRGSQIVDAVPDDRSPFIRDCDIEPETVRFVTGNRFLVGDDAVRMQRLESTDGCIKVRQVFFGPVNLYADAVQGSRHDQVRSDERPGISAGARQPVESASEVSFGDENW
jgi:hypothetical protein